MNWKIPPRRVDSSDCLVYVGRAIQDGKVISEGTPYKVHEGEWVEVLPVVTMQDYLSVTALLSIDSTGSPGEQLASMGKALDKVCQPLSKRLTAWNWTDMQGKALPPPHDNPDILKSLTTDELAWLLLTVRGESPGERKNASPPSAAISSGAAPSRTT